MIHDEAVFEKTDAQKSSIPNAATQKYPAVKGSNAKFVGPPTELGDLLLMT
jgi:hypothetical protein